MKNCRTFDVLIVYSGEEAKSAGKNLNDIDSPFSALMGNENYNDSYAYFLQSCKSQGLTAGFSTSDDVIDAGTCKSYWLYENKAWKQVAQPCYSRQIFDKLSPVHEKARQQRDLLFSSVLVTPFNDDNLSILFTDKLETYESFSSFSIPTIDIDDESQNGVKKSVNKLRKLVKKHENRADFSKEIILKDRFGAGGNEIYKLDENFTRQIFNMVREKIKYSYVLQPFLNFEKGFTFKNKTVATDMRLIFQNQKLIQTFFRMAKPNDFRCNVHKGGGLIYVEEKDVPKKVLRVARKMVQTIQRNKSFYALDFVVSDNGNVFFLEGNTGPGINWDVKLDNDEYKAKELIRHIVKDLVERVSTNKISPKPWISPPLFSELVIN